MYLSLHLFVYSCTVLLCPRNISLGKIEAILNIFLFPEVPEKLNLGCIVVCVCVWGGGGGGGERAGTCQEARLEPLQSVRVVEWR